jgi:hypothetical protein
MWRKTEAHNIYIVDHDELGRRSSADLVHSDNLQFESLASDEAFVAVLPAGETPRSVVKP